ncbi:flagellar biosynthetic protein FliO [Spirillospora albida]|uniref:flagellar biosynthetic protein FliO n=1 Tax=Spirillospora albida TaxID=58123 RepID=UPI0004BE9D98|nr:flagellar biosynthetic protein FliO [Spirillospora albida]
MIETVLRIALSLTVVLALMWVLAKVARRPLAARGGDVVNVLARQQLSRNSSVTVVQVTDRALVLGVTEGQITLLGEVDPAAIEQRRQEIEQRSPVDLDAPAAADRPHAPSGAALAGSALSPRTWATALDLLRERTARK